MGSSKIASMAGSSQVQLWGSCYVVPLTVAIFE